METVKDRTTLGAALALFAVLIILPRMADAARLKDIADVQGVRGNQLVGYGVVVGLNGTGDKKGTTFTNQSLTNLLERLGVRVDPKDLKLANVAAVAATATLPPFSKMGAKIDVTLSSIGDATTLQGGVLLMTPLRGADGKVYAVAQGPVSVGGFVIEGGGDTAQKNHPTVGLIARGASVEREISFDLFATGQVKIVLRDPDFITATRVQNAVNDYLHGDNARAVDNASVVVPLSVAEGSSPVELVARLEELTIEPDAPARVVVNERTGTVIMGEHVRVSTVALAHGNLNITIRTERQVSQPAPLAQGSTAVVNNTDVQVGEEEGKLRIVSEGVTLREVVKALNDIGATPRDLIAIFQAMQRAGALQAELVIM